MSQLKLYDPDPEIAGPLSREERVKIICSVLTGVGDKAYFCEETIKNRIIKCLQIVEEIL